jgi:hypothetical protein
MLCVTSKPLKILTLIRKKNLSINIIIIFRSKIPL